MTSRVIKTGADRDDFIALLSSYKLPCTVNLTKGERRSVEQNKLQWLWMNEAAEQLGEYTASEYQAIASYISACRLCEVRMAISERFTTAQSGHC
ncbi:hypothetical protein LCGC14_2956550, partial [marine sediment metagenome]